MSRKKLLIAAPALLLVLVAGYSMTKPKKVPKMRVVGTIYELPQAFLINLSEGHFAKLAVALELSPQQSSGGSSGGASSGSNEAAGTLPEEPLVREIVTNAVTGQSGSTLVNVDGRSALRHQILTMIERETDVKVEAVLFPELTVQ
jgi:flagellar FliL protein